MKRSKHVRTLTAARLWVQIIRWSRETWGCDAAEGVRRVKSGDTGPLGAVYIHMNLFLLGEV